MSGERIIPEQIKSQDEYFIYLKEIFVYEWCRGVIPANSNCLDLGCGDGYGTGLMASYVKKIIGIDVDRDLIAKANEKYGSDNRSFLEYDGKKLPFDDDTFEAVVSFQVIEHVKDDRSFVSEARRVLKKNGVFILATPNKILRLPGTMPPWNIYHVREYSRLELETLLRGEFNDVQILGTVAADEVMQLEQARVKRAVVIARCDFLNLRRLLPLSAASLIVKFLHFVLPTRKVGKFQDESLKRFNERDLYKIEKVTSTEPLDIVAVCRK